MTPITKNKFFILYILICLCLIPITYFFSALFSNNFAESNLLSFTLLASPYLGVAIASTLFFKKIENKVYLLAPYVFVFISAIITFGYDIGSDAWKNWVDLKNFKQSEQTYSCTNKYHIVIPKKSSDYVTIVYKYTLTEKNYDQVGKLVDKKLILDKKRRYSANLINDLNNAINTKNCVNNLNQKFSDLVTSLDLDGIKTY